MLKNLKYEDTMQCFFFSTKKYLNTEWQQQCDSINETIKLLSQEYIWHRDEFKVFLPIHEETNDIPVHLMSVTCFGDNVEDEWFIVYLLLELTKIFPHLIIQIEDNDGDFLLIEAADYLPSWANPDTTENRVFIFEQNIHIIPPHLVPVESSLKLNDALTIITEKAKQTKANPEIQEEIFKRISNYPQQIKENSHKAIVKLPVEVAALLTLKPPLVSYFVNTFCNLDALDAKLCKDIVKDDFILVEVTFTKFLYAMLLHTKIPNSFKLKSLNDKKTELGLKLLCGYRIIMAKTSKDIFSTSEYKKFTNSLSKNGYFKNNLEGSKEYTRLLNEAKKFFEMECPISSYVCNVINEIKSRDEFKSMEESLKLKSDDENLLEEDDDSWLNINPDQLNEFLNNQYGRKIKIKNNDPVTSHIVTSELTKFLKERSDLEGVEEIITENTDEDNIDFNSDEFVNCLEKMLKIISNNKETNDSEQSDFSDDDESSVEGNNDTSDLTRELASKLKAFKENGENNEEAVMQNLIQSLKEEGLSGPTSNVLRTVGISKSDLIDSDDDENSE